MKIKQIVKGDGENNVNININTPKSDVLKILNSIVKNLTAANYEENEPTIMKIYEYFKKHMSDNAQDDLVMDIGYTLTDIFERNGEFDKSVKIANEIINTNQNISESATIEYKKKYLNKIIGCAYSLAIAKKSGKEKECLLNNAEKIFNEIKPEFEKFIENNNNGYQDILFISGLYYSDYAAFCLNMGDYYKDSKQDIDYTDYYKKAKDYHIMSLKRRQALLDSIDEKNNGEIADTRLRIARSKSNIGSVYFRLNDYLSSIKYQKEALEVFSEIRNKDEKYRITDYLIGSYLALWKDNIDDFQINDFMDCCRQLNLMREYYSRENPHYEKAIKQIKEIKQIVKKLPQEIKAEAMNIFTIILD